MESENGRDVARNVLAAPTARPLGRSWRILDITGRSRGRSDAGPNTASEKPRHREGAPPAGGRRTRGADGLRGTAVHVRHELGGPHVREAAHELAADRQE